MEYDAARFEQLAMSPSARAPAAVRLHRCDPNDPYQLIHDQLYRRARILVTYPPTKRSVVVEDQHHEEEVVVVVGVEEDDGQTSVEIVMAESLRHT